MSKIQLLPGTEEKIKDLNSLGYDVNFFMGEVDTKIFGKFPMHYAVIKKDGKKKAKHAGRNSYDEAFDYVLMVFIFFYKPT